MDKRRIKVWVLPIAAFIPERVKIDESQMVISIVSPGMEHPIIDGENVYKFHFHDVTERYVVNDNRIVAPMDRSVAEEIVEVALKHRNAERWIIHCEAGISRSPGVAIGLARYIDLDPDVYELMKRYPCYNKHVRKHVEEAMREKLIERGELSKTGERLYG